MFHVLLYYQQFVLKNGGIKISIEYRYMYSVEKSPGNHVPLRLSMLHLSTSEIL